MNSNRPKTRVFRSIEEVQKEFFPESFKRAREESANDPRAVGVRLARESLEKVRKRLRRKSR